MLALIDAGAVVFSAIYDFVDDAMYFAERGQGAFRNEMQLAVSRKESLVDAKIIWEMNMDSDANKSILNGLGAEKIKKSKVAGFEFARVANGEADA